MPGGRPRIYTPEEAARRRRDRDLARQAAARINPRTCIAPRCWLPARASSDHCPTHASRLTHYGDPMGGPIPVRAFRVMLNRVQALRQGYKPRPRVAVPKRKPRPRQGIGPRLDAELVQLALAECHRLVVAPGQDPVPNKGRSLDPRYRLAIELYRLAHPPPVSPRRIPRDVRGVEHRRREQPVTAVEVFDCALTAWLCCIIPGAVTANSRGGAPPKLDTRAALIMAVGRRVLSLRACFSSYVSTSPTTRERVARRSINALAARHLGSALVTALAPLMPLVQPLAEDMMARGRKRLATIKRNLQRAKGMLAVSKVNPEDIPIFTFD